MRSVSVLRDPKLHAESTINAVARARAIRGNHAAIYSRRDWSLNHWQRLSSLAHFHAFNKEALTCRAEWWNSVRTAERLRVTSRYQDKPGPDCSSSRMVGPGRSHQGSADRFAAEGFVALAPDLYHGDKTRSPDQAGKMLMALNIAEAAKDMRGAANYLLELDEVQPKRVGAMGFCMGGQLALFAATEFPEQISAGVDFYGIHPNAQIDPAKLRVPVLGHFAMRDDNVPEENAHALVKSIEDTGGSIEAHFYDADHAFFNDTRPELYNAEAAGLAWERTLGFSGSTF